MTPVSYWLGWTVAGLVAVVPIYVLLWLIWRKDG